MAEITKENLQSQSKNLRFLQQKMNTITRKYCFYSFIRYLKIPRNFLKPF